MTIHDLVRSLRNTIPEYVPEPSDAEDNLPYAVLNELIQFTFALSPDHDPSLIKRIFSFLEELSKSEDPNVAMLLRDIAWAAAEQPELHRFKEFIGKRFLLLIRQSPLGGVLLA